MIKLIKSSFYKEKDTRKALSDFVLSAENMSMDKECAKFEEGFAKKQGRKYAVFVNSGSSANLALIQALLNLGELKKGDKVGFSALTWATNVMPLIQLGLEPVAIDCELDTLNISPETLSEKTGGIDALFITNVLGFSDRMDEIKKMCDERGVLLLEDNCESLGSITKGVRLGNFGFASTFSCFVGHQFSTIEGGMICTDDEDLHQMLLMVRAHGWNRNLKPEHQQKLREKHNIHPFYDKYTFHELGYNIRPMEINGFLGNVQLGYWDEIVGKREANFRRFHESAQKNPEIIPLEIGHMDVISNFAMPLVFKNEEAYLEYRKKFEDAEVEIRPIISGEIISHPFYKKHSIKEEETPNARLVHVRGFYFGNNPELDESEVEFLCNLLENK